MVITRFQSGFRRRRCTVDNIVTLELLNSHVVVGRKHLVSIFFIWRKLLYATTGKHGIFKDVYPWSTF